MGNVTLLAVKINLSCNWIGYKYYAF